MEKVVVGEEEEVLEEEHKALGTVRRVVGRRTSLPAPPCPSPCCSSRPRPSWPGGRSSLSCQEVLSTTVSWGEREASRRSWLGSLTLDLVGDRGLQVVQGLEWEEAAVIMMVVVVDLEVIKGLEVLAEEKRETLEEWGEGKEEETLATEDRIIGIEGGGIECEEDGLGEILYNLFNKVD